MFHCLRMLLVSLHEMARTLLNLVSAISHEIREVVQLPASLPPFLWIHQAALSSLPLWLVPALGLTGFVVLLNYLEARNTSLRRDLRTSVVLLIVGLLIYSVTG